MRRQLQSDYSRPLNPMGYCHWLVPNTPNFMTVLWLVIATIHARKFAKLILNFGRYDMCHGRGIWRMCPAEHKAENGSQSHRAADTVVSSEFFWLCHICFPTLFARAMLARPVSPRIAQDSSVGKFEPYCWLCVFLVWPLANPSLQPWVRIPR